MNIGLKIKEYRLKNNLTQEELANRCELTKGYISQLENNLTSPSISTLNDILEVLGVHIAEFFKEDANDKVVFKTEDFFEKEDFRLKNKINWIVPSSLKYEMEPILIELDPEGESFRDEGHPGEEFGYVLEGSVVLCLGNNQYIVNEGETFYYKADKRHYIKNNAKTISKILWVSTPPMF
jgi:transcriptional regulator with XRE-family HTH domain